MAARRLRLRAVRLLLPEDPTAPGTLDAHPLVREWFGERLHQRNETAWREAHARLYEHLRDTTREGEAPTLADLAPLYQAVAHGCRAGRHQQALDEVYKARICRGNELYASSKLGAIGSNLAAVSWFFDKASEVMASALREADTGFALNETAFYLAIQGRLEDALPALRASLRLHEAAGAWHNAASGGGNLCNFELLLGNIASAIGSAALAVGFADRSENNFLKIIARTQRAAALHAAERHDEAQALFSDAEQRQRVTQPGYAILYALQGYRYCDLLLDRGEWAAVRERAAQTVRWATARQVFALHRDG